MGKWTKEELEAMASDPRKLRTLSQRKPDTFRYRDLTKEVAKRTGYRINAVGEVMDALVDCIKDAIISEKSVKLGDVGLLYPVVKKARQGTCLKGGTGNERMVVPPRWELRFQPNNTFDKQVKGMEVTQKDIDNLYEPQK